MNIRGMGHSQKDNRSYYVIAKENDMADPINAILEKIGFEPYFFHENDEPDTLTNQIAHIKNNNYDIDFVFTENRLMIIVRSDEEYQDTFKKLILAYGIFNS